MSSVTCPHCKSRALIRTSRQLTALVKEVYCQCQNLMCGHTFVAHVEAVRTISPSATPDPQVALQISNRVTETSTKQTPALPALVG